METGRGLSKDDSKALKGLAVCLLLFHHLFYMDANRARPGIEYIILDPEKIGMIAEFAKICVPVFVFVTAYGLAAKYSAADELSAAVISRTTASRLRSLMLQYWYVFVIAQLVCNISGIRTYGEVYGSGLKSAICFVTDGAGLAYLFSVPTLNPTWWYMTVALLLPFALPLLYMIEKRAGWVVLPVLFFVSKGVDYSGFTKYLIVALMAVTVRDYGVIEKIEEKTDGSRVLCVCVALADLFLLAVNCFIINRMSGDDTWVAFVYLNATLLLVIFYAAVIKKISPFRAFLAKTGDHSMAVFLTHTFIYVYFFADIIYSFKYVPLIWLALYVSSMMLAVLLDYIRNKLIDGLRSRRNHD